MSKRWTSDDLRNKINEGKGAFGVKSGLKSQLKSELPKRSIASEIDGKGASLNVEQCSGREPLGEAILAIRTAGTCTVRFKAYRKRLADPDGNCFKYILDAISRSGALVDDSARYVRYITEPQEKVETEAEERVEVTLEYEEVDLDNLWTDLTKDKE